MDGSHFDELSRAITGSRRRALLVALGSALSATRGATLIHLTEAKKKKCPPCKKRKKGKCTGRLPDGTKCKGGSCQSGRCVATYPSPSGPTCGDRIKNGSETDVDCGGALCDRCLGGQRCASREDCASARCSGGICKTCELNSECGSDVNGACHCTGSGVCETGVFSTITRCESCPPDWSCYKLGSSHYCSAPCGSSGTCATSAGNADACKGNTAGCGRDGKCFQPLGGGPTRCGAPTVTSSCGCTSHAQCQASHGAAAFCVTFTPGACTCNGASTFCALPS